MTNVVETKRSEAELYIALHAAAIETLGRLNCLPTNRRYGPQTLHELVLADDLAIAIENLDSALRGQQPLVTNAVDAEQPWSRGPQDAGWYYPGTLSFLKMVDGELFETTSRNAPWRRSSLNPALASDDFSLKRPLVEAGYLKHRLREVLRFAASRSVINSAEEGAILAAFPDESGQS